MLLELSIIPLGRARSISSDVADLVKIIDASGLDYRLTAAGTILEGNWEQLMDVTRKCHIEMRRKTERVVTFMKIDDYAERTRRLTAAVTCVETNSASHRKSECLLSASPPSHEERHDRKHNEHQVINRS